MRERFGVPERTYAASAGWASLDPVWILGSATLEAKASGKTSTESKRLQLAARRRGSRRGMLAPLEW